MELKKQIKDGGACCLSVTTTTIMMIIKNAVNDLQICSSAVVSTPCKSLKVPGETRDLQGPSGTPRDPQRPPGTPRDQGSCRYDTEHHGASF